MQNLQPVRQLFYGHSAMDLLRRLCIAFASHLRRDEGPQSPQLTLYCAPAVECKTGVQQITGVHCLRRMQRAAATVPGDRSEVIVHHVYLSPLSPPIDGPMRVHAHTSSSWLIVAFCFRCSSASFAVSARHNSHHIVADIRCKSSV